MKETAIFDLDGTLIELRIDRDEFERCRASWASYLSARGVRTTLKPIWPELEKALQTSVGRSIKRNILESLDALEVAGGYTLLCQVDTVLAAVKAQFRKLALVTHNGAAFWQRVAQEQSWPRLFDIVITRDEMARFKPDLRACEALSRELAAGPNRAECWVIGNADVDRGLGLNLRRKYPRLVVRTFIVGQGLDGAKSTTNELDLDIDSVDRLLPWMTLS